MDSIKSSIFIENYQEEDDKKVKEEKVWKE